MLEIHHSGREPSTCTLCVHLGVTALCGVCSPGCDGSSDAGAGSSHVHPIRYRCVRHPNHLHEEPGHHSPRQEAQEA